MTTFLAILLGSALGHVAGLLIAVAYQHYREKRANKRIDRQVDRLVNAMREQPAQAVVRVPLVPRAPGDHGN